PVVVEVLNARPALAERQLDECERHDRDVDQPRGRRSEVRNLPSEPGKECDEREREREEIRDEPEMRPSEAIEAREERREELDKALGERRRDPETTWDD